jgi:hypothetical protein
MESLRMEAAMIIQSGWRAKMDRRHKNGKSHSAESDAAYAAMKKRIKEAEQSMQVKITAREGGNIANVDLQDETVDNGLQDAITKEMLTVEEERAKWGSEWHKKEHK